MITKEQYGEWRSHPATQFFRQFLKDRADALIHAVTEAWLNSDESVSRDEARGRVRELLEVEAVNYDTIAAFYQERDNGTEVIEDTAR